MTVRDRDTLAAWPEAGEEAVQLIAKNRETRGHARTLNRIRAAKLAGKRKKMKYLTERHLNSYDAPTRGDRAGGAMNPDRNNA